MSGFELIEGVSGAPSPPLQEVVKTLSGQLE